MRDALAEVLAVMTEPVVDIKRGRTEVVWLHDSPAEALEALHTRDLWPWSPGDETAPRWWCSVCDGSGVLTYFTEIGPEGDACDTCAEDDMEATGGYRTTGHLADPPSLAALVAVASHGAPTLLRVAELAAVLAGAYSTRLTGIVWRIVDRLPGRSECPKLPPADELRAMGVAVELTERGVAVVHVPSIGGDRA